MFNMCWNQQEPIIRQYFWSVVQSVRGQIFSTSSSELSTVAWSIPLKPSLWSRENFRRVSELFCLWIRIFTLLKPQRFSSQAKLKNMKQQIAPFYMGVPFPRGGGEWGWEEAATSNYTNNFGSQSGMPFGRSLPDGTQLCSAGVSGRRGGGVFPSNGVIGIYLLMVTHSHDWVDCNGVAFYHSY